MMNRNMMTMNLITWALGKLETVYEQILMVCRILMTAASNLCEVNLHEVKFNCRKLIQLAHPQPFSLEGEGLGMRVID